MRKSGMWMLLVAAAVVVSGCEAGTNGQQATGGTTDKQNQQPAVKPTDNTNTNTGQAANSAQSSGKGSNEGSGSNQAAGTSSTGDKVAVHMDEITAVRLIDGQSGWIGGNGWIAKTGQAGAKWTIQYQGKGTVQQIFALNGQQAWAMTEDRGLIRTTDGGNHWSIAGTVPGQGQFLHFSSASVGYNGSYRTGDGGKTWSKLPIPDQTVDQPYYHDDQNGWAVTRNTDKKFNFVHTTDGGRTWQTVLTRTTNAMVNGAVIRSAGVKDAWIELIGDSGMNQTAYSLWHTTDGGKQWRIVLNNATAGGGPAPGVNDEEKQAHKNEGTAPGMLYVVNSQAALMGGYCAPCDAPNTIGRTKDGGKSWNNGKQSFGGYKNQQIGMADAEQGWAIFSDSEQAPVMYVTRDGGTSWKKAHTFDKPANPSK